MFDLIQPIDYAIGRSMLRPYHETMSTLRRGFPPFFFYPWAVE